MANFFDMPPALQGDEQAQLDQVRQYLMQMSEQLNEAMTGLTIANFAPEIQQQLQTAVGGGGAQKSLDNTKKALRSMIIKTAEIVRTEMDEISTELRGQYNGLSSAFGNLQLDLTARIEANAAGIGQNYSYIETLQGKNEGYDGFVRRINERIFSGLIGTDALGNPVYGIAIGENVTAYDTAGNPVINQNAKMATFTKDRLSFWQGATELAYFSNQKLYITRCEILNELVMGRYVWKIQSDGSMGLAVEIV